MRLNEIRGTNAFKAMGVLVGCLKTMFNNPVLKEIVKNKGEDNSWVLSFIEKSLEELPDVWMKMFLVLNPDLKEEEVSVANVVHFAYEFTNDPEIMSLFFSQSNQRVKESSGSATGNIKESGTT